MSEHELGPLPPWSRQARTHIHYDADQMRAYAAQEVAKERERWAWRHSTRVGNPLDAATAPTQERPIGQAEG